MSSLLKSAFILTGMAVSAIPAIVLGQPTPNPPSDVAVTIRGENALDVTWVDNSENEQAFVIYRSDGGGEESRVGVADRNLTLFQDRASGIIPDVEYCYTVRARNVNESDPSNQACVTIPPRPASPSGLLSSRADNNAAIVLTWISNSANEDGFLIYRDVGGSSAFVLIDTMGAGSNRYEDKIVRSNGLYRYFVSAFNITGESEGSNVSEIDVTVNEPALPTFLEIETLSGTEVKLAWGFDLVTFAGLAVERSVGGAEPWSEVFRTAQVITEYADASLDPNTEYCYRLRLFSASAVEAVSEVVCSQTEFTVPPAPTNVDAEGLAGRTIRVIWATQPSPEILFRVQRRVGLGPYETIVDSLNALAYTDIGLSDNEGYCYRIQSFNPQFESSFSRVACAIVAPSSVANLRITAGPGSPTQEVTASWSQGTGTPATSFEVSFREAGAGDFSNPTVTNGVTLLIQGLDDLTAYEVQVVSFRARDSLSAQSQPVTATGSTFLSVWPGDMDDDGSVTDNDVVVLTSDACFGQSTNLTSDGLNVSWREIAVDPAGANPTVIRCDADQNGEVEIFDFLAIAANVGRQVGGSQQTEAAPKMPITSAAHRDRIRKIYESFVPEPGNEAQERLKSGLAEILQKAGSEIVPDELSLGGVFPNPIVGRAMIPVDVPEDGRLSLSLYSVTGQKVRVVDSDEYAAGSYRIPLDAAGLPAGVYFLVLESGGQSLTRSITIVK